MQNERNHNKKNTVERLYPITAICKDCGKEFTISVKEQLFAQEDKGFVFPKRCPECRADRKSRNKQVICIECGEVFDFTVNEQEFYKKNNFVEPRRCKSCRKARRGDSCGQDIAKEDK